MRKTAVLLSGLTKQDYITHCLLNHRPPSHCRVRHVSTRLRRCGTQAEGFPGREYALRYRHGTMNLMYINNRKPLSDRCFTEKVGVYQCVLAVRTAPTVKLAAYGLQLRHAIRSPASCMCIKPMPACSSR